MLFDLFNAMSLKNFNRNYFIHKFIHKLMFCDPVRSSGEEAALLYFGQS